MRAKAKRRQLYRRVTIISVVAAILVLLVVGFYYAYEQSNQFSRYDNEPVPQTDLTTLQQLSAPPYGPASSTMVAAVKTVNGLPFTSGGKPVVVYIGADYCMFCAAQRWSILLALMRFGTVSGLEYMSSSPSEGDYPTFTFQSATYTSKYIVFQGFEQEDRNTQPLDTVPSNYTAVFSQFSSAYPFINFGDKYVISGALWQPSSLNGYNYTGIYTAIRTNSTLGSQIKAGANVITALICKLTNDQPASVCQQAPISSIVLSVVAYSGPPPSVTLMVGAPAAYFGKWQEPLPDGK